MPTMYALKVNELFYSVEYFSTIPSTNTYLKQKSSLEEGMVVVANKQTRGRGRQGKKFYSSKGGLYFSLVLKPNENIINYITPMCGVAVREAIYSMSQEETKIKWVNDIYFEDKKVCGILAETKEINDEKFVIIGIGINTKLPKFGFNRKIRDIAGTVCLDVPNDTLNTQILNLIEKYYKKFNKQQLLEKYKNYSNIYGKKVEIINTKEICIAVDIDDEFRLVVEDKNGARKALNAGDVQFVK